jgi:hypothetical protein
VVRWVMALFGVRPRTPTEMGADEVMPHVDEHEVAAMAAGRGTSAEAEVVS